MHSTPQFNRIFLALSLFCSASLANAGAMGPVAMPYKWTGPYVGGELGWGGFTTVWGANVPSELGFFSGAGAQITNASSGEDKDTAFLGGFHLGYDYQFGVTPWVAGIEIAGDFGNFETERSAVTLAGPVGNIRQDTSADSFGTVRGKFGWRIGNALPFLTGGAILAKVSTISQTCFPTLSHCNLIDTETTRSGGLIGGGLDYRITPQWSVGVLGFWANLSRQYQQSSAVTTSGAIVPNTLIENRSDPSMYMAVARVSYHPSLFTNVEN